MAEAAAVIATVAGADSAIEAVQGVYGYNQNVWQFDKQQRQARVYQAQNMALERVGLWRDDMRSLFDITNNKMDGFTTVSTLVLGLAMAMLIDYGMKPECPEWLFMLGNLHCGASFAYALLSMVFSMYASIIVQQFITKTLTQVIRLPIPDAKAMTAASAKGRAYEEVTNFRTMMRIPVLARMLPGRKQVDKTVEGAEFDLEAPHIELFRRMQEHWMPLANYSRGSMMASLTHMTYALVYHAISEQIVQYRNIWGTGCLCFILLFGNFLMQKLDFVLTRREIFAKSIVHIVPPMLGFLCQIMSMLHSDQWARIIPPFIFFLHSLYLLFLLRVAHPASEKEHSKFRLTLLHEMQFPKGMRQAEEDLEFTYGSELKSASVTSFRGASGLSVPSFTDRGVGSAGLQCSVNSAGLNRAASIQSMASSVGSFQFTESAMGDQFQLRVEVQQYHRSAAMLLRELQKTRGASNNYSAYEEEFVNLSRWANEPENPALDDGGIPGEEGALDPRELSVSLVEDSASLACCAAGHPLREKQGQTVFHVHNRFCARCRRDLERKETRWTCDKCTKYDVCVSCVRGDAVDLTSSQAFRGGRGAEDKAEHAKIERMLQSALHDMRKRIPLLDDSKGRMAAPARRGSWNDAGRARDSDDVPLVDEITNTLPDPIKLDKYEEAMNARAMDNFDELPWTLFKSITIMNYLCFTLALIWSIVDVATPGTDLGIVPEAWLTQEYSDGLGRRVVALPPSPREEGEAVASWLREHNQSAAAALASVKHLSWGTLRHLDSEGWRELGVKSAVDAAKLAAVVPLTV